MYMYMYIYVCVYVCRHLQVAPGRFRWTNRAGVSWGLTWDPLSLRDGGAGDCIVGSDCGYHQDGYTRMKVLTDGGRSGARIVGVLGPGGERYDRV